MGKHELSIFIDESGDFGQYQDYCSFYIVTFLFHDQSKEIENMIASFKNRINYLDLPSNLIHAGPIIRREGEYFGLSLSKRRKAISMSASFIRKAPIEYSSFIIDRKKAFDKDANKKELTRLIKEFVYLNTIFFSAYKYIKVYYDNGQKELSSILTTLLPIVFGNRIIFKTIESSKKYTLSQIADVICTLELINSKIEISNMSNSELMFFKTKAQFKSNFYRQIEKKKIGK